MNTQPGSPRPYLAVIRSSTVNAEFTVQAVDRAQAVFAASQRFWNKYGSELGQIKSVLTVSDPYEEVRFTPEIDCRDRLCKLLPDEVIQKVIADSKGEIVKDENLQSQYCLKRSKRRRKDVGVFIAPNIKQQYGKLYYRVVGRAQKSKGGKVIRKRRYVDIPLEAKTLDKAVEEIRSKKLYLKHEKKAAFLPKSRSLAVLEKIADEKRTETVQFEEEKVLAEVPPKETLPQKGEETIIGKIKLSSAEKKTLSELRMKAGMSAKVPLRPAAKPAGSVWGESRLLKEDQKVIKRTVVVKDEINPNRLHWEDGRAKRTFGD